MVHAFRRPYVLNPTFLVQGLQLALLLHPLKYINHHLIQQAHIYLISQFYDNLAQYFQANPHPLLLLLLLHLCLKILLWLLLLRMQFLNPITTFFLLLKFHDAFVLNYFRFPFVSLYVCLFFDF